jgi:hypothetical protein
MLVRLLLPALLVLGMLSWPAEGVAATGDSSFAVRPATFDTSLAATKSYFVFAAQPGSVITTKVRISNTGDRTGTALLYPVDATTGQTSGTVYRQRNDPRTDVGKWVHLEQSKLALKPGTSVVVPFSIRVPSHARGGDHIGGIVAENTALTESKATGALQIRIRHLTIAAVVVQVKGQAAALIDATGLRAGGEHGYQFVYLRVENLGGLATKPQGSVVIAGSSGAVVARRRFQLDTFVPQTAIDYPILLPGQVLPPGSYHATVRLSYAASVLGYRRVAGQARTISRSFAFAVSSADHTAVFKGAPPVTPPTTAAVPSAKKKTSPPLLLLGAATALLALGGAAILLVRRRRTARSEPEDDDGRPVTQGENGAIAEEDVIPGALVGAAYDREAGPRAGTATLSSKQAAFVSIAEERLDTVQVEVALQEHLATGRPMSEILIGRGYLDVDELAQLFVEFGAGAEVRTPSGSHQD